MAIALGALQAAVTPYQMSSEDAVSYLDVADGFSNGRADVAVNGYWSPLYPSLLAAARGIARIPRAAEFPLVRAVNFAIWLLTIAAFDYLLRQVIAANAKAVRIGDGSTRFGGLPHWAWPVAGYAVFLWASLHWIGLRSDTPDLVASACAYVAAGIVVRASVAGWTVRGAGLLGLSSAMAYHARAAMFPIAIVFVALPAFDAGRSRDRLARVAAAALVFALVAGPFVALLSMQKHRVTFGDSGRINYAWLVNPGNYVIPGLHWQGGPPGFGAPRHPTRQIWPNPEAYEFNHPAGTFPPWTDPSYFYDGLELRFNLRAQLAAIATNLTFCRDLVVWPLLAFFAALFAAGGGVRSIRGALVDNARLVVPALAMLGLYVMATNFWLAATPLQPSTRYVAAALVLLACALISGVRLPPTVRSRRIVTALVVVLAGAVAGGLVISTAADLRALRAPYRDERLPEIVAALNAMGVRPGDKVAIVGRKGDHEFWARMDGVQIVSQMPDGDAYIRTPDRWRADIRRRFAAAGATAMVYRRWFPVTMNPEWRQVLDTQYWVSILER